MFGISKIKDFESKERDKLPESRQIEERLLNTAEALEKKANRLEEISTALRAILGQIEKDKDRLKDAGSFPM